MKKRVILSLLLGVLPLISLRAQDGFDTVKLDDYLSRLEKQNKAMLGVVITRDGKTEYEQYIGFASVEDSVRNNGLTKFRIGSISKMFTATIIFQLVEEGTLSLDTKLAKFFPQIPNAAEISIADLLGHTSGIHNFTSDAEYSGYMTKKKSKEEMLALMAKNKPDFTPGEKTAYSNSNYVLLGYIIEKITRSPYKQELEERICSRLNLANTHYGGKIDPGNNDAASYRYSQGTWILQPETDMSIPHGAGAISSTPEDLTTFINAFFSNTLISETSLNHMKPEKQALGKGLIRFPFGTRIAYGHNGGIDGFVSNLAYFPDEKVAVAVTANGMNYQFNDILIGILSIYFTLPFEIPDFSAEPVHLESSELTRYEGEFSSEELPLTITLKVDKGQLYGQATGQSAFPLTPFSRMEFRFDPAGIIIKFSRDKEKNPLYNSFTLYQGGAVLQFKKR